MTGLLAELKRFERIDLSRVACHGAACCKAVRYRVFGRLMQYANVGAALAAVPELIRWGPVQWPAHWCDLPEGDGLTGDCGVHADVAAAVLTREAVPHSRGRAVLRPAPLAPAHWRASWNEAGAGDAWIAARVVHHEVIRVGDQWWDPSEARWFSGAGAHLSGGRVLAVREEHGSWQLDPEASATQALP
ncbi:hypothetical protein [Streptomyces natalensis]|uniref:Uncharacterized protein n=1 Tax=Streptomyces natalensis ATCC 27448 TaxID=1240678 RepID=A0A0D7CNF1_9ACTN|nr:hypothetical protein [Streptomyces natalensis]KIZ17596.1 hypothetical protein SNA_14040 [Streptomyces natalensis ATCC 27448]